MGTTIGVELNNKPGRDGRYAILIRLTRDRKVARLNTNIYIAKKNFNKKGTNGQWVRTADYERDSHNNSIEKERRDLEKFWREHDAKRPGASAKEIMQAYKDRNIAKADDWLVFFDQVVDDYLIKGQVGFSKRIKAVRNKLEKFIGGKPMKLDETRLAWFKEFETYLYSLGNHVNTVGGNLKVIKQIYRIAIDHDLVENPDLKIFQYKVKGVPVERDKLTEVEIKSIEKAVLEDDDDRWIRNFFMFSYYCAGIRFSDCATLQWNNVSDNYLRYVAKKTGKPQQIKMPRAAQVILLKCKAERKSTSNYIFKLVPGDFSKLSGEEQVALLNKVNVVVNARLKVIARKAKVRKRVSFHTARHSFAYNGFKKTKDLVAVQQLLQHSDVKETQTYITSLTNDRDRDILGEIFN